MKIALMAALLLTASRAVFAADCEWFGSLYEVVAQSRDNGIGKSATFMTLVTNQKDASTRDLFFDIVYQVYSPEMINISPEELKIALVKRCKAASGQ